MRSHKKLVKKTEKGDLLGFKKKDSDVTIKKATIKHLSFIVAD